MNSTLDIHDLFLIYSLSIHTSRNTLQSQFTVQFFYQIMIHRAQKNGSLHHKNTLAPPPPPASTDIFSL